MAFQAGDPFWKPSAARPAAEPPKVEMKTFLNVLLILTSLTLMALILLHRGKGGGLSSLFGGTMQSSLAGSSVVEKNLDRLTLFVASIWLISIIGVGLLIKVEA